MPPESWYLLSSGPGDPAFNMALDEALLQAMPRLGQPVLRFYGWTEPAASFGYFQRYADVERLTALRPLVRRPTGGGIVPHDADWTYSLAFPPRDLWYSLAAKESYQRVHEWIQAAFASLGVTTELALACRKAQAGQCFQGHEKFDLLWLGQKIAGAAQRRTRDGLLIQGSVQPPPSLSMNLPLPDSPLTPSLSPSKGERVAEGRVRGVRGPTRELSAGRLLARSVWQEAMRAMACVRHGARWASLELDTPLKERAQELAHRKYSQPAYNQKR